MGIVRRTGKITQSSAMVEHDSKYHVDNSLFIGESYTNNTGTLNNFLDDVNCTGAGAVTPLVGGFTISSGIGTGHGTLETQDAAKKITLSTKPVTLSFRVRNVVNGAGVDRHTVLGFYEDFSIVPFAAGSSGVFFHQLADNTWLARTNRQGVDDWSSGALVIADNDILSIVAQSNRVRCYQNGTMVMDYSDAGAIPTVSMSFGFACIATAVTVAAARQIDIASILYNRYV